ncbi:Type I phosphodiesterase / nucleotide pyrophosphatase [Parapedobacter luteus]|uniref:Type I phosphodiesterase / nucleotide pyrophosphatase n=1 Tax=Parapedobacter luteus TaxID=623280 RepID=A0A1T4ZZI3_9SPHI|nr:alkaline phosphatase family protein [Parapedobacter luteus]SKB28005.1 Type I phosphodiesterase / nucleotide pyrophosphatase [Parapedobacter luteus]
MKKTAKLLTLALAALWVAACQSPEAKTPPVRKVLFAIVDGIPADVIERVNTPWIDSVAAQGGYTRAYTGGEKGSYSESPTISAVCYTHFVTGTWTNKHNVWDNGIAAINYHYPTFFWYLKQQYPEKKIGIFSTWEDNRTKLVGEGKSETGGIKMDVHVDGYELDTAAFPHDPASHYIHLIDERVSEEAAQAIRNDAPDLSWVYLQYTDDIGHQFGDSPQMDSAVVIADHQVGRLWQAVQYRKDNFNEDWLVYIVTDHGRDDKGYHHGGQTPRERGIWLATNDKNLNTYFHERKPASVDVLPTILRFLDVKAPREYQFEWDGIPLSGNVSHVFKTATLQGDSLSLAWEALNTEGNLTVWLATTNNHASGGTDVYTSLMEVPVAAGRAIIDISEYPSDFYKVVLESADHTANRWVIRESTR